MKGGRGMVEAVRRACLISVFFVVPLASVPLPAQTCRVSSVTGGSSIVTNVSGVPVAGTVLANSNSIDGSYYELTNALGIGSPIIVPTMYSDWVETGADNNNNDPNPPHVAVYGASFVNTTDQPVTVTRVDFTSNIANFTPTIVLGANPLSGWALISRTLVRWTGSVTVPARSAQDFIFADSPQDNTRNNTTRSAVLNVSVITSSGTYAAAPFTMTALTSNNHNASNAVVSFDLTGADAPVPMIFVPGQTSAAPVNVGVRVAETGDNGNSSDIASGLQLTITIPAGWSSVSVPTIASPWRASTMTIVQPTATTAGRIVISTNKAIAHMSVTPANSLVIRATAPRSSATSLYLFPLQLAGQSKGGRTIDSFNNSVVQVLGNGTEAINAQFQSAAIGSGPVRQIDFSATFNVTGGTGSESVSVNVWNNTRGAWDPIQTVTPGSTNTTVSRTFTSDFLPYVDALNRMKIQLLSNGTTTRTLRLDQIQWTMTTGYTVNSATGSDTNLGDVARPFRTIAKANSVIALAGAAYVEVGTSQTGAPYSGNVRVINSGISGCPTLFQGVKSGGLLPRVRGTTPVDSQGNIVDYGFDLAANFVQVDGFQIENTGYAAGIESGVRNAVVSNNDIRLATNGYGVVVNGANSASITNNSLTAGTNAPLFAIADSPASAATLIDGNTIVGASSEFGIYTDGNSPVIQRNIIRGNGIGVWLAGTTGTAKLWNNTIDANISTAVHGDTSGTIQSRNNIITNSANGWQTTTGRIDSDYDDVFGNFSVNSDGTHNDQNYSGVTPGAHSLSSNPLFVQTNDPSTGATYYHLGPGSPCIGSGINLLGYADIGAIKYP